MAKKNNNIIASLDIGTTKVCALIAKLDSEGVIEIIGAGNIPFAALKKGAIVDLEKTINAIEEALRFAEERSDSSISSVYTNIGGNQIKGMNSRGVVAILRGDREITKVDIEKVIEHAKISIPTDREVIHILPKEYIVDDQDGIKNPLGLSAMKLEADVYIITSPASSVQNISKSIDRSGYDINQFVFQTLADSYAVLSPDEKDLGVVLVNIGGDSIDLAIFIDGSLCYIDFIPIGGNTITNDIAVVLGTPKKDAEKIKKQFGCACTSLVTETETIEVPNTNGKGFRTITRIELVEIIEARVREICELIKNNICQNDLIYRIGSGIVITGGAANMEGIAKIAEEITKKSVRIGFPQGVRDLVNIVNDPIYSTSVGLILFGAEKQKENFTTLNRKSLDGIFGKLKNWWQETF
ncbi:MAG: cell division protein FtsA [bacterium]